MIPRAKHQHGPTTTSANPGSAERGEAAPNREHQLMDYLDGRVSRQHFPRSSRHFKIQILFAIFLGSQESASGQRR